MELWYYSKIGNNKSIYNNSGFPTAIATGVGNPTATRQTLISPTTRHLIHFGTETTIGDLHTQDDMFIRFSDARRY